MSWTLQDGVGVCRLIEPIAIANGYHVALGGSVLVDGVSEKDLDVFLYKHTTFDENDDKPPKVSPEEFITRLSEVGVKSRQDTKNKTASASDGRYKHLIKADFLSRRIDFLFLLPT